MMHLDEFGAVYCDRNAEVNGLKKILRLKLEWMHFRRVSSAEQIHYDCNVPPCSFRIRASL